MGSGTRNIGIAALVMLFGVIGPVAPWLATASRSARLGGDHAPGAPRPRPLESRRVVDRKPSPGASTSPDLAELRAEESEEDEDDHRAPTPPPAGPFSAAGHGRPRGVHASRFAGRPAPRAPAPLFLLCLRLVC